jgi:ferredoxin
MSKPVVNQGLCIGCGTCESLCSDCFKIGEDGHSHILDGCKNDCCDLKMVADSCPVAAITLE